MADEREITLELEPKVDEVVVDNKADEIQLELMPKAAEEPAVVDSHYLEEPELTEAEMKTVNEFAEKIDITDTAIVLQYGASAQKKIADFSETALQGVKNKDLGEVGTMITDLVVELKGFDVTDDKKGFLGIFKKEANSITKLKSRYDAVEKDVDKITVVLEGHQQTLTKDIVMLDKMYESNLSYYKELTMYIIAGKKKLEEARSTKLVELRKKAEESGLSEDAQAANDFSSLCDRFEKKLYDLELTRTISIQMAPQIRMIQNGDALMVEKIQSTIINTIPLWKNQMVLALGIQHSEEALKAERAVSDLTNELLKKNADQLSIGATEIAKESERSIVDIETVKHTNEKLIETLDNVLQIQEEGRQKRKEAENELGLIEDELKKKLLEVR